MTRKLTLLLLAANMIAPALAQPPQNPVACYAFTGNADDGSGNGYDGTVVGAVSTTDRFGTPGRAYAFDGILDHIAVPDFADLGISSEVSIGMWVRAESFTGNFAVSIWPDNFNDRLSAAPFYGHNGGCSVFWDFGDASTTGRLTVIPYAFSSAWEHFTFTSSAENNRMRVFHNGVLLEEVGQHSTIVDADRTLTIGGGNVAGYSHWLGDLDEVVLYDRELSDAEVADLYTDGAPCASLVAVPEIAQAGQLIIMDPIAKQLVLVVSVNGTFRLHDATGRVVAQQDMSTGRHLWNCAGLSVGAYVASFSSGSGRVANRVIME